MRKIEFSIHQIKAKWVYAAGDETAGSTRGKVTELWKCGKCKMLRVIIVAYGDKCMKLISWQKLMNYPFSQTLERFGCCLYVSTHPIPLISRVMGLFSSAPAARFFQSSSKNMPKELILGFSWVECCRHGDTWSANLPRIHLEKGFTFSTDLGYAIEYVWQISYRIPADRTPLAACRWLQSNALSMKGGFIG